MGVWGQILYFMRTVNERLSRMEAVLSQLSSAKPVRIDVPSEKLLNLPDHQRRIYLVLCAHNGSTATQIGDIAGQSRAHACVVLNELVALKYANRKRVGKEWIYEIAEGNGEHEG